MHLTSYPSAIAAQARICLANEATLFRVERDLAKLAADIETAIANDDTLSNDTKRKAKKLQLQQGEKYLKAEQAVHAARTALGSSRIEHDYLVNQFAIAKLEARTRLATLDLQAA